MVTRNVSILIISSLIVFIIMYNIYKREHKALEQAYVEKAPLTTKLFNLDLKYVIDNKCTSSNGTTLLVILVTSYLGNVETRSAMRRAFPNDVLQQFNVRRVFLLGLAPSDKYTSQPAIWNENERFNDLLQGNFIEAYKNLTYKHVMGIQWASMKCQQAQYIVKMDDDTVVNLYKLISILQTSNFPNRLLGGYILKGLEPVREPANKWYITKKEYSEKLYPTFLSGWFYITNPYTCSQLIKQYPKEPFFWVDDVYVTGLLAQRSRIKHYDLGKYFTVHSEFLECCMRDINKFSYDCEIIVGPNGGDNNLFYEFNKAVAKCFFTKCFKRKKTLNQTCVAEKKHPLGRGNSLIETFPLI